MAFWRRKLSDKMRIRHLEGALDLLSTRVTNLENVAQPSSTSDLIPAAVGKKKTIRNRNNTNFKGAK